MSAPLRPRLPPPGPAVTVVSAFPAGRQADAAALIFEYMAATQAETGRLVPASPSQMPAVLQREYRDLPEVYRPPGALLIADHDGHPAGCVGLTAGCAGLTAGTAEVRRLYVRPGDRRVGIARALMSHVHHHAATHGLTRLILDVLPARVAVISFYRRLGYTDSDPQAARSPVPMTCLERLVSEADIIPGINPPGPADDEPGRA